MKQKNRVPLYVEPLEDRWVPATVRLLSGSLIISNLSVSGGLSSLTVKDVKANNTFDVKDNGSDDGTYNVAGNIYVINPGNAKKTITFDMNGWDYTGNLFIQSGNGNDTINIMSSVAGGVNPGVTTPGIAGNVTVLTGPGNDSVGIASTGQAFFVGGDTQLTNTFGVETVAIGNATGVTSLLGNVTVTGASNVTIGAGKADFIGGNLTVNSTLTNTGVSVTLGTAAQGITIGGSFYFNGGSGSDSVTVNGPAAVSSTTPTVINGSFNDNSGGASANVLNFTGPEVIGGNLNYQSGSGSTTFQTAATTNALTVQGSANFNWGDANNVFDNGGDVLVNGNTQVTMGNGNDSVFLGTTPTASMFSGNLSVRLGNGTDQTIEDGTVGGTFFYTSGNGNDSLSLGAGTNTVLGYATFGNGNDTLSLGTSGDVSGVYNGGGRLPGGGNVFVQGTAVLTPFFELTNFP